MLMMKSKKIGFLIYGDYTMKGVTDCQVDYVYNLKKSYPNHKIVLFFISKLQWSKSQKGNSLYSRFDERVQIINEAQDLNKFDDLAFLICGKPYPNIIAGLINENVVKSYSIISYCTNELKIPVLLRMGDSEDFFIDYKQMCLEREVPGKQDKINTDPHNIEQLARLRQMQDWNFDNVYWFANGIREEYDWVAETLYDRTKEKYRYFTREFIQSKTIYAGDDIFFTVRDDFYKYEEDFKNTDEYAQKLIFIGFFDTSNVKRCKAFEDIFKKNEYKVPVKIMGKGTDKIRLQNIENIEILEETPTGKETFSLIHNHMATIMVSKGHDKTRYITKSTYDAVIARTPILIYEACETGHLLFPNNPEFYFKNEKELRDLYELLLDKDTRNKWIEIQQKEIMGRLQPKEGERAKLFDGEELEEPKAIKSKITQIF